MTKTSKAAAAATRADRKFTHRAARLRDVPAVKAIGAASEAADQPPLIALGIVTIVAGAALRRPGVLRGGVRMLGSELLATGIKTLIKRSVDRTRPERAIASGTYRFGPGDSHDHDQNSFPSGHTAGAVAVARSVARDFPASALPAYAAAGAVAAVQMPRGKHYVADTLAGAVIGYVAEAGTSALLRLAEPALVRAIRRWRPSAGRPGRSSPR